MRWRMLKFLFIKIQVLHSPPVLCASLHCKLDSNSVGIAYYRYQNWLVDFYAMANAEISFYKIRILHSPSVLLHRNARFYAKLTSSFLNDGECLNFLL